MRALLRSENREKRHSEVQSNTRDLMDLYGVSRSLAMGTTVVLTTLCLRAGKVIADGLIPEASAERLCLTMMLQGSRDLVSRGSTPSPERAVP